jgi:hypothetical protein
MIRRYLSIVAGIFFLVGQVSALNLSSSEYAKIAARIWKNECAGTVSGLTSWNRGEDFASVGIGHFIWYPAGKHGPFEESFPELIAFLKNQNATVPEWLLGAPPCPWRTRQEFLADFNGQRMRSLRSFLANTVSLQGRFLAQRLENALPKMLKAAPASERERIRENFYRVASGPSGMYALIDYVNFKGEGTLATERYAGKGWGLLQVLEGMQNGSAVNEFSKSAVRVLELRVHNSPSERHENRWLPGWLNRVDSYRKGLSST